MRRWLFRAIGWLMAVAALVGSLGAPAGATTYYEYPGQSFQVSGAFSGPMYTYYSDGSAESWIQGSNMWGYPDGGWQYVPSWAGPSGNWSENGPNSSSSTISWDYWTAANPTPGTYSLFALFQSPYWVPPVYDTLVVMPYSLSASASPSQLNQGQTLTITANTSSAPAISVVAATPGGNVALASQGSGNWAVTVPASLAPGTYTITVTATYSGGSQSTTTVSVTVTQPPTVTGSLSPNPAKLGDTVAVTANTAGATFTSVTATDPDGTVTLANQGGCQWKGQLLEDWATSGTYPITLTAYIQGGGQVTYTVNLTLSGTDVYVIPTNVW